MLSNIENIAMKFTIKQLLIVQAVIALLIVIFMITTSEKFEHFIQDATFWHGQDHIQLAPAPN